MFLKEIYRERWRWRKEEKEGVGSYWMTLSKREGTENRNRKHQIAVYGGLALERLWTCRKTHYRINGYFTSVTKDLFVLRQVCFV
jgi:hypothetical protein